MHDNTTLSLSMPSTMTSTIPQIDRQAVTSVSKVGNSVDSKKRKQFLNVEAI